MPQTASLHIQARATDPIRVVELTGHSIRIGRAAFCDIRLPESTLADEVCRVRFRRGVWQIVPIGPIGDVWLDEEVLDQPRALAFDAPFRVGSHWITLREHEDATPTVGHWSARREDWTSSHSRSPAATIEPLTIPIPADPLGSEMAARHRSEWDSHAVDHDRLIQNQREAKRWESRMKAVGEKLRAGSVATATPAPPRVPVSEPRKTPLRREPVARRSDVSPLCTPRVPKAGGAPIERMAWRELPSLPTPKSPTPELAAQRIDPVELPAPITPKTRPESYVESDAFAREIDAISALSEQTSREKCADLELITHGSHSPKSDDLTVASSLPECEVRSELEIFSLTDPQTSESVGTFGDGLHTPSSSIQDLSPGISPSNPEMRFVNGVEARRHSEERCGIETLADRTSTMVGREDPNLSSDQPSRDHGIVDGANWESYKPGRLEVLTAPHTLIDLEEAFAGIDPEDSNDERDEEPRVAMRLGSARQVPVALILDPEHPTIEPELVPEPGKWADQARFVTHTYLGDPVGSGINHSPIVHETSTQREHEPFSPFPPEGRETAETSPFAPSREWPRVNDLLAAQGVRSRPNTTEKTRRKTVSGPLPTDVKEPETWSLPLWLGWTPVAALAVVMTAAGLFAAWTWASDDYQAGIIFERLADESGKREPLPEGVEPAGGSWWRTNAENLVAWAAFNDLDRTAGSDPSEESRALLERASEVSPLDPTVRHAHSLQTREGEKAVPLARVLGQSRDVLTLAAAGRRLLTEGKQAEALEAYRDALAMAAQPASNHTAAPLFLDDPETARYGLPGEDRLRPIVREMAESKAWTYREWSRAIPNGAVAKVTTARVLRERGDPSAQSAIDAALAEPESSESLSGTETANRLAASAEALALRGNWAEARERYRQAIAITPIDIVRRAWWLNVAAFSLRLNEETERQKGLEAAKNPDPNDDVTQRVVEIQKKMGYVAPRTTARVAGAREVNPPGPARK